MFFNDLIKSSMSSWLVIIMGIQLDCEDPQERLERFYQRY